MTDDLQEANGNWTERKEEWQWDGKDEKEMTLEYNFLYSSN